VGEEGKGEKEADAWRPRTLHWIITQSIVLRPGRTTDRGHTPLVLNFRVRAMV